jgi:uncharacterized protein (DUF924 family)
MYVYCSLFERKDAIIASLHRLSATTTPASARVHLSFKQIRISLSIQYEMNTFKKRERDRRKFLYMYIYQSNRLARQRRRCKLINTNSDQNRLHNIHAK